MALPSTRQFLPVADESDDPGLIIGYRSAWPRINAAFGMSGIQTKRAGGGLRGMVIPKVFLSEGARGDG
jgi:hypothetical protein